MCSRQNHSFRMCCIRISQERNKPQLTTMNLSANNSPTPLPDLFGLWVTSNQLSHSLNHRKRVYIYRSWKSKAANFKLTQAICHFLIKRGIAPSLQRPFPLMLNNLLWKKMYDYSLSDTLNNVLTVCYRWRLVNMVSTNFNFWTETAR